MADISDLLYHALSNDHRPRQPIGLPIFASSPDTTAPLLLLRAGPLRALHARLSSSSSASSEQQPRGTLVKTKACPTSSIRNLPPSVARTLLHPPPVTLVLQDYDEEEEEEENGDAGPSSFVVRIRS